MNINSFNDGYGNGGVAGSLAASFTVQRASLQVSVLLPNRTYTVGDVIPVYAIITYPDGTFVSTGTVTASISNTNSQTTNQLGLAYVQGQGRWVGAYVVGAGDTSGILIAQVSASDSSGNSGSGGGSAILNAPVATSSLNLYYFILAAAAFGSGATTGILLRKLGSSRKSFEDFFKLAGGELGPQAIMITGDAGYGTRRDQGSPGGKTTDPGLSPSPRWCWMVNREPAGFQRDEREANPHDRRGYVAGHNTARLVQYNFQICSAQCSGQSLASIGHFSEKQQRNLHSHRQNRVGSK